MIESKELKKLNKKLVRINDGLKSAARSMPTEVGQWLVIGANDIRNTIILSMRNTPKSGRHYKRGKNTHIASSKGNAPAIDSGDLLRSIIFDARPWEVEIPGRFGPAQKKPEGERPGDRYASGNRSSGWSVPLPGQQTVPVREIVFFESG